VVDVDGHEVDDVVGQITGRIRVLPDLNAAGPWPERT